MPTAPKLATSRITLHLTAGLRGRRTVSIIAFASNRNSSYQIFIMTADGSDVHLLANTEGRGTAPKWGKDGTRIYFSICRNVDFGVDCQIFAARTQGFSR